MTENNANVISKNKKANLIIGCKNSKIEQGIRVINKYAFAHHQDLEKIELPDTVRTISKCAFLDCQNLKEINLNLVTSIEESAFENSITPSGWYIPPFSAGISRIPSYTAFSTKNALNTSLHPFLKQLTLDIRVSFQFKIIN